MKIQYFFCLLCVVYGSCVEDVHESNEINTPSLIGENMEYKGTVAFQTVNGWCEKEIAPEDCRAIFDLITNWPDIVSCDGGLNKIPFMTLDINGSKFLWLSPIGDLRSSRSRYRNLTVDAIEKLGINLD